MEIGQLITLAFRSAAANHQSEHKQWIDVSLILGASRPNSLLCVAIQRCGELDVVLRSMETELKPPSEARSDPALDPITYVVMLSELWVGSLYEVVRLLPEGRAGIQTLAHHLRLLRVQLEKLQIAADRRLKEPLQMMSRATPGAEARKYLYEKSDPKRSHIMPTGISVRGSMMWQVIDVENGIDSYWLERRQLSDDFLSIFDLNKAT